MLKNADDRLPTATARTGSLRIVAFVDCSPRFVRATTWFAIMIMLALSGCQTEPPAKIAAPPEIVPINRLLELMRERLLLMHEVARSKWNEQKPIADLDREKRLLNEISEHAKSLNLDPEWVRAFFAKQIEAAKIVQQADFEQWESADQGPFSDAPDLAILRNQIDRLNKELLVALKQAIPLLKPYSGKLLNDRIDAVMGTELAANARDVAVEPLQILTNGPVLAR